MANIELEVHKQLQRKPGSVPTTRHSRASAPELVGCEEIFLRVARMFAHY